MLQFLKYIVGFVPSLLSLIVAFVSVFSASTARLEQDKAEQINRIAALEQAYKNGEIEAVDEAGFFDGDLDAELESGLKFNEISFLATHNSYQSPAIEETFKLYNSLENVSFGAFKGEVASFWSETLTNQLNSGIRSLEMDIEVFDRDGEISFTCMHNPYIEMATSCYDFALGMKEIAMWSDNNPNHLPVTIIVEPKSIFIPLEDMKAFGIGYADDFDAMLRETLGDKLFTPADMLGDYETFGAMRADDGWCEVKDMLGKVLILLHQGGTTEDYIDSDPTLRSQAMFPMLRINDIDRDCASFILCNEPGTILKKADEIAENRVVCRTRADTFKSISEKRLTQAMESAAQIVSTDYPPRTDSTPESYVVSFGNNTTVRKVG